MDSESVARYLGQQVLLTLKNGFWYKAKIISANDNAIEFIEMKGRRVSVSPEQIIMLEEIK